MSHNFKAFQSLDEIYSGGIVMIKEPTCSVCAKSFKTEKNAQTHIDKRFCHTYLNVFQDTPTEKSFLNTYIAIVGTINNQFRAPSLSTFRKNKRIYNAFSKLYMFCFGKEINYINYLEFCLSNYTLKNIVKSFHYFTNEKTLLRYYDYRIKNLSGDDNEKFYQNNRTIFHNNNFPFTIRSLEKGNIQYDYLFAHVDFNTFVDTLSRQELGRLKIFLRKADTL